MTLSDQTPGGEAHEYVGSDSKHNLLAFWNAVDSTLSTYLNPFEALFPAQRLRRNFRQAVKELLSAQSPRIARIAVSLPWVTKRDFYLANISTVCYRTLVSAPPNG